MTDVLNKLMTTIHLRRRHPSATSYTSTLFEQGVAAIGDKVIEEAHEVVDATRQADSAGRDRQLIHESADTVYHLCVLLGYFGLDWSDVEGELARRFGTSGLEEKASRPS